MLPRDNSVRVSSFSRGFHRSHVIQPTLARCVFGEGRRIDFILRSMSFSLLQSFASDDVDLGSDHRAVYRALDLPKHKKNENEKRKFQQKKGWEPNLAENAAQQKPHTLQY